MLTQGGQWFCATCNKLNTSSLSLPRLMLEKPLVSGWTSMDVMSPVSHQNVINSSGPVYTSSDTEPNVSIAATC